MEDLQIELNENTYKSAIEILGEFGRQGYWYTVGLLPVDQYNKRRGIGSGVLIQSEDDYAIITAGHVADEIKKHPKLALAFGTRRDISQMYFLPVEGLVIKTIYNCENGSKGPDIALIKLPQCHVGGIKSVASFYRLKDLPELRLDEPGQNTLVCTGILGKDIKQQNGYEIIPLGELAMVASSLVEHREGFDYITCLIDEKPFGVRLGLENEITSFKGVSGSPLWQVQKDGSLRLIGIAYYQNLENPKDKKVFFHGPKSIYIQIQAVLKNLNVSKEVF